MPIALENNQSVNGVRPDILSRHEAFSLPVHKKKDKRAQNPFESLNSQEISLETWITYNMISLKSKFLFQSI